MANTRKQIRLSLAMLTGAIVITTGLYMSRPDSDIAQPVYTPVTIDVTEAVMVDTRIPIQAQGTVNPLRSTAVISEVRGRIVDVSTAFNVGGFVAKGEVLLRIDPRDYQTSLLRTQAVVESSQSKLAQEQGRAEVARREWQKLPKGGQRSQAAKDLYLRIPQLKQAQAELLAAQADFNTAQDNLDRTVISAPYDALIREKHSEIGQFVSPGSPLLNLFSVDTAEVRLAIPQSKLAYLDLPGVEGYSGESTAVDLYTDVSGELKHWPGQMHRTEGVFDERSRVLYTVARIEDPYALHHPDRAPLRIGTFVNANIQGKTFHDVVTLPSYILRAGNLVWVVDKDLYLRNRKVSILRTGGEIAYVTGGLESGDLISLTAMNNAFAGAKVKIVSTIPSDQLGKEAPPADISQQAQVAEQTEQDLSAASPESQAAVPVDATVELTVESAAADTL